MKSPMGPEEFKRLFLPLHPKLYRIAYSFVENAPDAEDILQDVYGRLWQRRGELERIRTPEAYAVTLVKNACIDFFRKSRHRRHSETTDQLPQPTGRSPERETIAKDTVNLVKQLIGELPENQQQVLRLQAIQGLSPEEIETITGFSAVNIRVLLSRARKTIREKYDKMDER